MKRTSTYNIKRDNKSLYNTKNKPQINYGISVLEFRDYAVKILEKKTQIGLQPHYVFPTRSAQLELV